MLRVVAAAEHDNQTRTLPPSTSYRCGGDRFKQKQHGNKGRQAPRENPEVRPGGANNRIISREIFATRFFFTFLQQDSFLDDAGLVQYDGARADGLAGVIDAHVDVYLTLGAHVGALRHGASELVPGGDLLALVVVEDVVDAARREADGRRR